MCGALPERLLRKKADPALCIPFAFLSLYYRSPLPLPSHLPSTKINLNFKPFFGLPVGVEGPLGIVLNLAGSVCNLAESPSAPCPHLLFV